MTTTRLETLPATWVEARDLPFFRITARLFTSEFCVGASVLLASYDEDLSGPARTTAPLPAAQSARDLVPVPVRQTR